MANYNTERYNNLIASAEDLYLYLSGNYMDALNGRTLTCGNGYIPVGKMQFFEVCGYRKLSDDATTLLQIKRTITSALEVCAANDCAFAYFLTSAQSKVRVFFAFETDGDSSIPALLKNGVPSSVIQSGFLSPNQYKALSSYGGIVVDNTGNDEPIADKMICALQKSDGIVCKLCVPISLQEIDRYETGLLSISTQAEALLSGDFSYNSGARHTYKKVFEGVEKAKKLIEEYQESHKNKTQQYWNTCTWFAAPTNDAAHLLGASISGVLNSVNTVTKQKANCFYMASAPFQKGVLGLPTANYFDNIRLIPEALRRPSLLSVTSSDALASLMQLPMVSYPGFRVTDMSVDENSLRDFTSNPPINKEKVMRIGMDAYTGEAYGIPFRDVSEHVLVTGATGSGKTNTVMGLVRSLYAEKCPICIIEPSKKDYWHLISEIPELRVYSAGRDAMPLRINPMIPEDGVIIGNHIDALLYAFSGAFEMEEPTRLALDGLIKYTYEKFGWELNEIAFDKGKTYPMLSDMQRLLKEYCTTCLAYGSEVAGNVQGALLNRLSSLNSGITDEIFNDSYSLTGRELCSGMTLIELDDLSLDSKPFVANLLFIKIDQYLRRQDATDLLRNVVVLEEAHNIFARMSEGAHETSKDRASRYFSNMLSQIRGYGAGVIVADQGASQLHVTAIANTKTKITHAVSQQQDADEIAYAAGLSEYQKGLLPSLKTGEAVVNTRGQTNACKVIIDSAKPRDIQNIACLFCKQRGLCEYSLVQSSVEQLGFRKNMYAQRIFDIRYDAMYLKYEIANVAQQMGLSEEVQPCLLGCLLDSLRCPCGALEKRRILYSLVQEN